MQESTNIHEKTDCDAMLFWMITDSCNFSCYQCVAQAKKLDGQWVSEKVKIAGLKRFLGKLSKPVLFQITGGEPLLVENIIEVLQEVTKKHYLFLISNLVSPRVKELADTIDPARVNAFMASAHMQELEKRDLLKTFISHCILLREKGFTVSVVEVAYPFQLHAVNRYRKIFSDYGIELQFEPFRGIWDNKRYPDAYTEEELRLIEPKKYLPLSLDNYKRKGKLCNAGYNIAVVGKKGKINPCFFIDENMGTINRSIRFRKYMRICPFESCRCPFPVFFPAFYEKALANPHLTIKK